MVDVGYLGGGLWARSAFFLNDMTHSGTQQTKHTRMGVKKREGKDILPMWQGRIEGRIGREQNV